jgi:hypothetical protein
MMQRVISNGKDQLFTGLTDFVKLDYKKLGLEKYNFKIKSYTPDSRTGLAKVWKEKHLQNWLDKYRAKGVIVILYRGKSGKITTVQKEYARQNVIGCLFIDKKDIHKLYSGDYKKYLKTPRRIRQQVERTLKYRLQGVAMPSRKGILYYLNRKEWYVEIRDGGGTVKFRQFGLKEHEASILLSKKMSEIEYKITRPRRSENGKRIYP